MSFSITGQGTEGSNVGVGTDGCLTDWISIPCATNSNNPSAQSGTPSVCVDRICGMVFNSAASPGGSVSVPVSSNNYNPNTKKKQHNQTKRTMHIRTKKTSINYYIVLHTYQIIPALLLLLLKARRRIIFVIFWAKCD